MLPDIFGQETQHKAAVFLQKSVFPAVTAVGLRVRQVLWPVQFDGHLRFGAMQINLHLSFCIKRDWQPRIQAESTGGVRQRFQPPVKKGLARASGTIDPVGIGGEAPGGMNEEIGQGSVHPIAQEPTRLPPLPPTWPKAPLLISPLLRGRCSRRLGRLLNRGLAGCVRTLFRPALVGEFRFSNRSVRVRPCIPVGHVNCLCS